MADVRVPWSAIEDAFGVDGTVTRPAPNATPIETPVVWSPPITEDSGPMEFPRSEAHRVLALSRAAVAAVPVGTLIVAPAEDGGASKTWRVDGVAKIEDDHTRLFVIEVA